MSRQLSVQLPWTVCFNRSHSPRGACNIREASYVTCRFPFSGRLFAWPRSGEGYSGFSPFAVWLPFFRAALHTFVQAAVDRSFPAPIGWGNLTKDLPTKMHDVVSLLQRSGSKSNRFPNVTRTLFLSAGLVL